MAITEIQKQTNANIQEKANLIWEIATHLVGLYKPHEYGKVMIMKNSVPLGQLIRLFVLLIV